LKKKLKRKKVSRGMSTKITYRRLRWMCLVALLSVANSVLAVVVAADSLENDGNILDQIKSFLGEVSIYQVIILCLFIAVVFIIYVCREKEKLELYSRICDAYDENSDYLFKVNKITYVIKEYQPDKSILKSEQNDLPVKKKEYTLSDKIFVLKLLFKRKKRIISIEQVVECVVALGTLLINADILNNEKLHAESVLLLLVLIFCVMIFADILDEKKKNDFVMEIVEAMENEVLQQKE